MFDAKWIEENVPVYVTPNEENGSVASIATIVLTGEEFSELRKKQNNVKLVGDVTPFLTPGQDAQELQYGEGCVGGSEISVYTGDDTYGRSMADLLKQKINPAWKPEISPEQQRIFDLGHYYEYPIAAEFCKRYGLTLYRPSGMLYCVGEPGIFANIDYIGVDKDGTPYILEIKNINGSEHKKEIRRRYSEGLTAEQQYVVQMQYQMYVSGITQGFNVCGWCESPWAQDNHTIDEVYPLRVDADASLITTCVTCARTVIEAVRTCDEKLLLQLPGATPKDFTIIYGEGEGELVTDDQEWKDACDAYSRAVRTETCAKEAKEKAEKELRRLLGSNKKALVHNDLMDVEITTKTRETKTWDLTKLREVAPDVLEEGLSFSITEAKLKKLPNKEDVLSCLTVEEKPVAGIKIKVQENQ